MLLLTRLTLATTPQACLAHLAATGTAALSLFQFVNHLEVHTDGSEETQGVRPVDAGGGRPRSICGTSSR